ncbi:TylF/MycF family methyltransferase [Streptosporangium sp. NPDC049248]|uniref:TylF/MycF family methyltransferase n=1 Tax=unclassified Streptosporangium TaxID=2632669 RepID=UPI0034322E29
MTMTASDLYLDLMKRVVCNTVYQDPDMDVSNVDIVEVSDGEQTELRMTGAELVEFSAEGRGEGRDWPRDAHTMIGMKRLNNLQECTERALADGVPGDFMETGVWRGGACIFMRAVLAAHGVTDRRVWVADSFEGIPEPDERYPDDKPLWGIHLFEPLAISQEQVQENFRRYGLLDEQVEFVKGRFADTLPTVPVERLSVLRLDGDLYESTMDALVNLYPKLSPGGFLIVDDYHALEACAKAVHDYRNEHAITDPIVDIDWCGVYWRKEA